MVHNIIMRYMILYIMTVFVFWPAKAFSQPYSDGDSCNSAGAWHQKNDANGVYNLVCDGSAWVEYMAILNGARIGINASTPLDSSILNIVHDYNDYTSAESWRNGIFVDTTQTGNSGSYQGLASIEAQASNEATGAYHEVYGLSVAALTADDGQANGAAYGGYFRIGTHASDEAYGVFIADRDTTGGDQYGVYIALDDPDTSQ